MPISQPHPQHKQLFKISLHLMGLRPASCRLHRALPINKMAPLIVWFSAIWIFLLRTALSPPISYWVLFLLRICRSSFYIRNQKSLATAHSCHSITYHLHLQPLLYEIKSLTLSFLVSGFLILTECFSSTPRFNNDISLLSCLSVLGSRIQNRYLP